MDGVGGRGGPRPQSCHLQLRNISNLKGLHRKGAGNKYPSPTLLSSLPVTCRGRSAARCIRKSERRGVH